MFEAFSPPQGGESLPSLRGEPGTPFPAFLAGGCIHRSGLTIGYAAGRPLSGSVQSEAGAIPSFW